MAYGVISHWVSNVAIDEAMEAEARDKYLPGIKALGAQHVFYVSTGATSFDIVTIYPDEATATAAAEKQSGLRAKAAAEMPVRMVGDARGKVFASF